MEAHHLLFALFIFFAIFGAILGSKLAICLGALGIIWFFFYMAYLSLKYPGIDK